jgi:hypothetical protein
MAGGRVNRVPEPIEAMTRLSSPLRKRWQRTPPVALPLAGYSANGVTLTLAPDVPGSAPEWSATVTRRLPYS